MFSEGGQGSSVKYVPSADNQGAGGSNQHVVAFDPETAHRRVLGPSLQDWAAWLLADPDVRGTRAFATAWQDTHGPLAPDQRLIPWRFFALGGTYDHPNLTANDAAECLRIRGPFAQQVHDLPRGATVQIGGNDNQPATRADLQIIADYAQIHLFDEQAAPADVPEDWGEQLIEHKIATDPAEPSIIGLTTGRSAKLPITVEVLDHSPGDEDLDDWDRVVEASIELPSGTLVLNGPTAPRNKAAEIYTAPGTYRIRHYTAGLDTITDDALQGDDHYRIRLWPEPYREHGTLKV